MSDTTSADVPAHLASRFAAVAAEAGSKTGPIQMINMIRFNDQANYAPGQAPDSGSTSGRSAYVRYGELAGPFVAEVGGSRVWASAASTVVVGPEDESWDAVFAVQYPDRAAFLALIANPEYQAVAHHRAAAVADSRLIMIELA